jgi:integrase
MFWRHVPAHGYVSIPVSNYSEGRLHSAISPASGIQSMRNLFIAFKLMWATARFWGYAEKNICEGIVLPTMNIPDKKWFTEEQMKHSIGEANEPYKSMFWICAETGSRGEELCALKVESSNLDQRVLKIRRSVWKGELQTTKSKKGLRTFAISSQLCEHLNPT